MMLGGLPEAWVQQPILMIFVIFFNVLVFLTMVSVSHQSHHPLLVFAPSVPAPPPSCRASARHTRSPCCRPDTYSLCSLAASALSQLNFIIAIIVDSYAVVNEEVKELESHQEFFTDLTSVIW